jgi:LmbE family N-acetylglucosaminyl deacetylase
MTASPYTTSENALVTEQQRLDEGSRAARELGVEVQFGDFEDNHLSQAQPQLVAFIDKLIAQFNPTEVFTCLPWFNDDHTALYRATLAAMRKNNSIYFWGYEMPQQSLGYQMPEHGWLYVKLDREAVNRKTKALCAYETQQLVGKTGPVSLQGAMKLTELRGSEVGAELAERQLLLQGVLA